MKEYKNRDNILKKLGFKGTDKITPYQQYLRSALWTKKIRPRIVKLFNSVCTRCHKHIESRPTIHHMIYSKENLSGTSDVGLILLCPGCHYKAEIDRGKQRKNSLKEANNYVLSPPIKTDPLLKAIYALKTTPSIKSVALALYSHCMDNKNYCWPSVKTLATQSGLSTRTIHRSIKQLEKLGLITRERRTRDDGSYTSNLYLFTLDSLEVTGGL